MPIAQSVSILADPPVRLSVHPPVSVYTDSNFSACPDHENSDFVSLQLMRVSLTQKSSEGIRKIDWFTVITNQIIEEVDPVSVSLCTCLWKFHMSLSVCISICLYNDSPICLSVSILIKPSVSLSVH